MSLKRKWKLFAIGYFFSNELSADDAEALYDTLIECESSYGVVEAISKVLIWAEFERMEPMYLVEMLQNLAQSAQETEESP